MAAKKTTKAQAEETKTSKNVEKKTTKKESATAKTASTKKAVKKTATKKSKPVKKEVVNETQTAIVKKEPKTAQQKADKAVDDKEATEPQKPNLQTKIDKSGPAPLTMEDLLSQSGYVLKAPKPGQVISGMITDINRRMVLIDIGAKTEGLVVDREYDAAKDFIDDLSIGDEVTVYVMTPENERGQILLSLKRALLDQRWAQFAQFMETGEAVKVKGLEVNKGGLIVYAGGLRGFVPSSQFGKEYLGQMEKLLDKEFEVKVIEVDREKNRLIFSERHVSEAAAIAKKSAALEHVVEGDVYEGVVSGIMPFGVFVGVEIPLAEGSESDEAGKVDGLVHISEISWEKVNDPNDYFKLGDRVKVKVLGIDENAGKLNLSVKQLTADPWESVTEKYPEGAKVTGRVTRIAPFGVFVTLEPGVDGLIHISKVPASEEPKIGEAIEIFVESVDVESRRMSLGVVLTEVPVSYK